MSENQFGNYKNNNDREITQIVMQAAKKVDQSRSSHYVRQKLALVRRAIFVVQL